MPKFPTFPTLYDDVLQVSMTDLKKWDYLNPGQNRSGTITWSRNGNQTNSISIIVNTHTEQPYLLLGYKYRNEPRNYKVQLVTVPSNLGKGCIWYFLCPETKKRCRKLYSIGGYFLHREAFKGIMYDTQTQSKQQRQFTKTLGVYFKTDDLYKQLHQKHFKRYYAGKPTKRYLRIMEQLNKAKSISHDEINRLILGI